MSDLQKILVIVPAFNEEGAISDVIREIRDIGLKLDILVVNDGSDDRTEFEVRATGCKVVSLPFNLGIGGAVQTGFKYAANNRYSIAIQVDGDGQHIASEIPKLIDPIQNQKADVVIGSRFLEKKGYTTSWIRKGGVAVFMALNSLVLKQKISDNTSGFRAYNSKAIQFLAEYYPQDYPEPESVILLGTNGFRLAEVPARMRERAHGQSSISAARSIYYMVKVVLAIFVDLFKERICK
jgi:glycosyltransferase involved in cell wall biosynthesis